MRDQITRKTVPAPAGPIARDAILRVLVSFPIACFFGALATDIAYAGTANMMWSDFSAWLLAAGILLGILAAILWCVGAFLTRRSRSPRPALPLVTGSVAVLILALLDNLVHSRDAWTSVVPTGLALSCLTVIVMLVTVWFGSALAHADRTAHPDRGAGR